MASTVDFDRITEYNEKDEATLNAKIDQLTEYVRKSRYTVFYTGAGVSTSAGVPDYRGPTGCWTMKALGKKVTSRVSMMEAQPTPSHMAQATLINRGIAHYVVTTNLDGLYRKSGLKAHEQVCNLHGDVYAERCTGCGYEFERNYHVRNDSIHVHDHRVGKCERCGSAPKRDPKTKEYLRVGTQDKDCGTKDTHINFGEYLDDIEWEESTLHCKKADLVIVAGTSMSLRHITHLPFLAQKRKKDGTKGKVVIINLQETPDDDACDLRIFSKTDIVFEGLMNRLEIPLDPIPVWRPRDAKPIEEIPAYIGSYYREHARKLEEVAKMREAEALQREMADISVGDKVPESSSDSGASSSGPAPPPVSSASSSSSSSSFSVFRKLFG